MACQTLFFRSLPAPKNTLFCLCFGAPRFFSKPRFSTLTPFWGSPSGRFFSIFGQTVFFRFPPGPKTPRCCLCFGVFPIFFKSRFSTFGARRRAVFSPIFGQTVFF